ncbi:hypothetical protein [Sporosarcina sp. ZBG7A]|uniref:hypothetical protein n=1 Tax=Sporosarcina sp. ZBG7A TaxID=1582223 RepID=UPI00068BFE6A|nr:hypothetical protein [Sporosarcina sp. ZBG7A]
MHNNEQTELENAKQQLELSKQQDKLLEEIEIRLRKMKRIAEYAAEHQLTQKEITDFNRQIEELQDAINILEVKVVQLSGQFRNDLPLR